MGAHILLVHSQSALVIDHRNITAVAVQKYALVGEVFFDDGQCRCDIFLVEESDLTTRVGFRRCGIFPEQIVGDDERYFVGNRLDLKTIALSELASHQRIFLASYRPNIKCRIQHENIAVRHVRRMIWTDIMVGSGNLHWSFNHRDRVQACMDFPSVCQSNVVRQLTDGKRHCAIASKSYIYIYINKVNERTCVYGNFVKNKYLINCISVRIPVSCTPNSVCERQFHTSSS